VKPVIAWTGLILLGGLVAWQAAEALQDGAAANSTAPPDAPILAKPPAAQSGPKSPPLSENRAATPMAERSATLGVLNKRNGLSRDLVMKPGQAMRLGDLVVRLRACEETAPWEPEKWTGAFVQVITRENRVVWRKIFSGWLYKESPSLNIVEHPIYDVWVKACKMRHADVGPSTIIARGGASGSGNASSAPKSPEAEAVPAAPPAESAAASTVE
jgi:hypothetical protein